MSVFVGKRTPGEDLEAAAVRLREDLRRVDGTPSGTRIAVTTVGRLVHEYDYGVIRDEPPPGHYLVGEGDMASEPDYDRMAEALAEVTVKNLKL